MMKSKNMIVVHGTSRIAKNKAPSHVAVLLLLLFVSSLQCQVTLGFLHPMDMSQKRAMMATTTTTTTMTKSKGRLHFHKRRSSSTTNGNTVATSTDSHSLLRYSSDSDPLIVHIRNNNDNNHQENENVANINGHPHPENYIQIIKETVTTAETNNQNRHPIDTETTTTLPQKELQLLEEFSNDIDNKLTPLRPPRTEADISAPFTLISAGSSYTRLWTSATWEKHSSRPPHVRYARHVWRWRKSTTARKIFPTVLILVSWALSLTLASHSLGCVRNFLSTLFGGAGGLVGASMVTTILTGPLALLLTFRANASLGRLQEARQLVGRLVLHSRTLSSLLKVHLFPYAPEITMYAARHLALLGWSLKAHVRGESKESEQETLQTMLDTPTVNWLLNDTNGTSRNAITARIRQLIMTAITESIQKEQKEAMQTMAKTSVDDDNNNNSDNRMLYNIISNRWTTTQLLLEGELTKLEEVVGGCERLYSSPIPPTYSRHLSRIMFFYLICLPIGLVTSSSAVTKASLLSKLCSSTFITAIASYVFVGIDEVGMEVENAFQLLPLQQLVSAATMGVKNQFIAYNKAPPIPEKYNSQSGSTTKMGTAIPL